MSLQSSSTNGYGETQITFTNYFTWIEFTNGTWKLL